jgi:membrane-bound serine protease (ClpP class)
MVVSNATGRRAARRKDEHISPISIPGRKIRLTFVVLCLLFGIGWSLAGSAGAQPSGSLTILRLKLTGVVDPFMADYLDRGITDATSDGDAAVLIEIDTPGGLDSSMRKITKAILNATVPIICYVAPQGARAASAGAFVLMSCPIAAMAPGTNVGAATPVGLSGATESQKAVNDAAATMLSLAEARGRNKGVAVSFVTDAVSISAEQALSDSVIDLISPTQGQLLADLNGRQIKLTNGSTVTLQTAGAEVLDRGMGGFIGFLHGLIDPDLAFIFFWFGLGLIVLEVIVPGHIFSGTVGTILLVLAIVSFGLLPVRLIGIGLLVASAVAFAIEAANPGLGIWGIVGVIALVLGGWFLYDRAGGGGVSPWVIIPVAAFVALFFGFVVTKARKLRDIPPPLGPEAILGRAGVALASGLDPTGVVRVDAEEWRAVSGAGPIAGGTRVRVVRIDGLVLTVEPLPDEHAQAGSAPLASPVQGEGGTT